MKIAMLMLYSDKQSNKHKEQSDGYLFFRSQNKYFLLNISNCLTFTPCVRGIRRHLLCSHSIAGKRYIYVINSRVFRIADGSHIHLVCQDGCAVTRTQNSHFWICVGVNDGTAFTFDKCPRIIRTKRVEWRTVPFRHLDLHKHIHIFRCAVRDNRIYGYAVSRSNLSGAHTDAQIK